VQDVSRRQARSTPMSWSSVIRPSPVIQASLANPARATPGGRPSAAPPAANPAPRPPSPGKTPAGQAWGTGAGSMAVRYSISRSAGTSAAQASAPAPSGGSLYGSGASPQSSSSVGGAVPQSPGSSQPAGAGASQPAGAPNPAPTPPVNRARAAGGAEAQRCILHLPRNCIRFYDDDISSCLRQSWGHRSGGPSRRLGRAGPPVRESQPLHES